jgi:hypothetical protein
MGHFRNIIFAGIVAVILLQGLSSFSFALDKSSGVGDQADNILVVNTDIILTDDVGNKIDSLSVAPLVFIDYTIDCQDGFVFAILGEKGAPRGERLAIFTFRDGTINEHWIDIDRNHNPWKIMFEDVDGDAQPEVIVGTWKKTRFHPVFDNRLFVYSWENSEIFPKWLGSRLSSPFDDFDFRDVDGDGIMELIALELQRNGLKRVMSYKWTGFGFEGYEILEEDLQTASLNSLKEGTEK